MRNLSAFDIAYTGAQMLSDLMPDAQPAQKPPDELLVERARARDATAFDELVRRHRPKLRRLASRMVASPSDQDDVVQNALLAAWEHLPGFAGRAQFSTWMYRVTTNAALMVLRRQVRKLDRSVGDVRTWTEARLGQDAFHPCGLGSCWVERPEEAMQNAELRNFLRRHVEELPPILRRTFVLRHIDGLSVKEAADALGVTKSTVKSRLHRACLALREAIHRNAVHVEVCRSGRKGGRESDGSSRQTWNLRTNRPRSTG